MCQPVGIESDFAGTKMFQKSLFWNKSVPYFNGLFKYRKRCKMATIKKIVTDDGGNNYTTISQYRPALNRETHEYKLLSRTHTLRIDTKVQYPDDMNMVDIGRVSVLARHALYRTGLLADIHNRRLRILGEEDIAMIVRLSPKRNKSFIRSMRKLNMLRPVDVFISDTVIERQWYLSPVYFICAVVNDLTYALWHDQIDTQMPEYARTFFAIEQNSRNNIVKIKT